ncbi:hypothetical protein, partial [uncultured Abyssibacter sp.]|uniref:hypothetical protein n=1 Tax=uncultured Abyssibacter sp. TaxID=2320202 RepID=UPI0032B11BB7
GGGGGDDQAVAPPSISAAQTTVSVTAEVGEVAPSESVSLAVQNLYDRTFDAEFTHTGQGIRAVRLLLFNEALFELEIDFISPRTAAIHEDTATLRICIDANCASPVQGSPVNISTTYTITEPDTGPPPPPSLRAVALDLDASAIAWDPANGLIHAATGGSATPAQYANSIVSINPVTGEVVASTTAGGTPTDLSASDDGAFIYAAFASQQQVVRFSLPNLQQDLIIPLGIAASGSATVAGVVRSLPGQPRSVAVVREATDRSDGFEDVVIFDDDVARPLRIDNLVTNGANADAIVWNAAGDTLFGKNYTTSNNDVLVMALGPDGLTLTNKYNTSVVGDEISTIGELVYFETGEAIDPSTGEQAGFFHFDSRFGNSIALDNDDPYLFVASSRSSSDGAGNIAINRWNREQFIPERSLATQAVVNGNSPEPKQLLRWGDNGLAFFTVASDPGASGYVVIINDPLLTSPQESKKLPVEIIHRR